MTRKKKAALVLTYILGLPFLLAGFLFEYGKALYWLGRDLAYYTLLWSTNVDVKAMAERLKAKQNGDEPSVRGFSEGVRK